MPPKPSKRAKITQSLPCISRNIGHGDLVSGMKIDVPNIMNIHHTQRSVVKKCQNVPPKHSKRAKTTQPLPYISLNIGHGDLVSGMQIDVPNIMHIHHTRRSCAKKCQNVPPKPSKRAKITQFLPYISLNIGHGDLVSGMQIDVPYIMHIPYTLGS